MQPIVVAAPHPLALTAIRERGILADHGIWLSRILRCIVVGLLEEVVQDLHLDLDVAAGKVEDGALGHYGHRVLLLGVLRCLGLALNLGSAVGVDSMLRYLSEIFMRYDVSGHKFYRDGLKSGPVLLSNYQILAQFCRIERLTCNPDLISRLF